MGFSRKPAKIPGTVQLPGGIRLSAVRFKVVERHEDGSPKLFEILPRGMSADAADSEVWALFADEERIRSPGPVKS